MWQLEKNTNKQTNKIHLNAAYKKLTSELQTHTDFKGMDKSISCK